MIFFSFIIMFFYSWVTAEFLSIFIPELGVPGQCWLGVYEKTFLPSFHSESGSIHSLTFEIDVSCTSFGDVLDQVKEVVFYLQFSKSVLFYFYKIYVTWNLLFYFKVYNLVEFNVFTILYTLCYHQIYNTSTSPKISPSFPISPLPSPHNH